MVLHPSHRLTSSRSFARVHYLYSGRAIEWGSLMGCENLPRRGVRFGIFKKVRIFATELAGILIS